VAKPGRPRSIDKDPQLIDKIADCFLVAFTDAQTALYCGVHESTVNRIRNGKFGELSKIVKIAELTREMKYRKKIWDAKGFWQGAAWFLERKYPTQFAKPEIQLAVNQQVSSGPTNVVILGPERARVLATRYQVIRAKTLQLLEQEQPTKEENAKES
jgi:hypothetical protein